MTQLTHLSLNYNPTNAPDEGAIQLAHAISQLTGLEYLCLQSQWLVSDGLSQLANVFHQPTNLNQLVLNHTHKLGTSGYATQLTKALTSLPKLNWVYSDNDKIDDVDGIGMVKILKSVMSLRTINFSDNPIITNAQEIMKSLLPDVSISFGVKQAELTDQVASKMSVATIQEQLRETQTDAQQAQDTTMSILSALESALAKEPATQPHAIADISKFIDYLKEVTLSEIAATKDIPSQTIAPTFTDDKRWQLCAEDIQRLKQNAV